MRTQIEQNNLRALNTERMYATGWQQFADWCERAGRTALPADVETIALYVVWAFETRGHRIKTVQSYLSAIRHRHREAGLPHACSEEAIHKLMRLEARQHKERSGATKALPLTALQQMVAVLDAGKPVEVRDQAILVLLFNAGLRRSEIASLDLASLSFHEKGADLYLGATKADPTGAEPPLPLKPAEHEENFGICPIRTLRAWLAVRGEQAGPLFYPNDAFQHLRSNQRMNPDVLAPLVKKYVARAGFDPKLFSPHSFRAGMMVHAVENGADTFAVMKRSRHKTPKVAFAYLNQLGAFQRDVMKL